MSELYDIFFSAQLIDDFDEAAVRKNMAQLFKANEAALEKLFSGKPQLIKRGVNKAAAIKYKAAMQKAGAVARIRKHAQAGEPAPAAAPKPTAQVPKEENLPSSSDIAAASTPARPTDVERVAVGDGLVIDIHSPGTGLGGTWNGL